MRFDAKEHEFATKMTEEIPSAIADMEKAYQTLSKHSHFIFVKTAMANIDAGINNLQSRLSYFEKIAGEKKND